MEWTSTRDLDVLALTTHMHLRGESAYIAARLPDGELMNLLVVPAWNFNWQNLYYVKPGTVLLPAACGLGHRCVPRFPLVAFRSPYSIIRPPGSLTCLKQRK